MFFDQSVYLCNLVCWIFVEKITATNEDVGPTLLKEDCYATMHMHNIPTYNIWDGRYKHIEIDYFSCLQPIHWDSSFFIVNNEWIRNKIASEFFFTPVIRIGYPYWVSKVKQHQVSNGRQLWGNVCDKHSRDSHETDGGKSSQFRTNCLHGGIEVSNEWKFYNRQPIANCTKGAL